jgi:hypothetical protein
MVNQVGIGELFVAFIKPCKLYPHLAALAKRLQWVDCFYRFRKCFDYQIGVVLAELNSIKPLVNVVRILS